MTRFMWCSTRSTVSSKSSRILLMNTPSSETSSWFRPPAGSSRRSRRGFATSARASSTRFWTPYGSAAAGKSARSRSPDDVEYLERVLLARPSARARGRRRARSRARTSCGRAGCSGTSGRCPCRRSCAALSQDRLAVELDLPGVRLVEARDDVEGRRLPGAVRPDEPRDLPLLDVERDAVEATMPPKRRVTSRTAREAIGERDPKRARRRPRNGREVSRD